ncbi:MFS transporter [Vibrio crassostreae]|nr:MFS transporter [Vibrio crassostreae]CAK2833017.1 MFS transporter [Vibrio crassostreae]CAK2842273.1 MFS transporter [Vibrio crassostreae]CAK2925731.1 MFS transporter [Vibrio crassostreae]CAK2926087.1 MFS transporter [Vibrio crassostreae]
MKKVILEQDTKVNFTDPKALCLLLVSTLTVMSNATIAPALPGLAKEFAGASSVDLLVTMLLPIPALFIVLFAPILGFVVDKFGSKKQLIISAILFACSGAVGAELNSLESIIVSRAVLGISVAGLMTATTALIADYFSGKQRGQFMGLQQAFSNIGGIVFVVSAGYLATFNPRMPFYIYGAAILLVPIIAFSIIDEPKKHSISNAIDVTSVSWKSPLIICSTMIFFHLMVFYIMPTQLPFYMEKLEIDDPSKVGLALGVSTFSAAISALFFARILSKIQSHGVTVLGFFSMSFGLFLLSYSGSFYLILLACAFMGVGMGLVLPNFMARGIALVPENRRGIASGILTSSIFVGQFVSPLISSWLIVELGYEVFFGLVGCFVLGLAFIGFKVLKV